MPMNIRKWIDEVADLVYPRMCIVCGSRLCSQEKFLCIGCLIKLPYTNSHLSPEDNQTERLFRGYLAVKRAVSMFFYYKGSDYTHILLHMKYFNQPEIGVYMGRLYASQLAPSGFFDNVDVLIPVPLSTERQKKRGYNQSERIAYGIHEYTGISIQEGHLVRRRDNNSQTQYGQQERLRNTEDLFQCLQPQALEGLHILLIDDVITTGATLMACCKVLEQIPQLEISILSLAVARQ